MDESLAKRVSRTRGLKKARKIPEENDMGYIEYKRKICDFRYESRIDKLASQMSFRLYEGDGKAIYNIGFSDDGIPLGINFDSMLKSLKNLYSICLEIKADLKSYRVFQGEKGYCANVYIEKEIKKIIISDLDL
tara:strand:+ start:198 stop:599 length:402 start_codon:yes stop_codon:yes gene_type:complete